METLIKASESDFDKITQFYKYVISDTDTMLTCCRWIYGLHPADDLIMNYIKEGCMYYTEADGIIRSAVAVNPYQSEDYKTVAWPDETKALSDDEVGTVHILAVNPSFRKQGIATATMKAAIQLIKDMGGKSVRLDALITNHPAKRLYESLGFVKCDVKNWYAKNLGLADFVLYEYSLY